MWFGKRIAAAYRAKRWKLLVGYVVLLLVFGLASFVIRDRIAEWANTQIDERLPEVTEGFTNLLASDVFLLGAWLVFAGVAVVGFVVLYKRAGRPASRDSSAEATRPTPNRNRSPAEKRRVKQAKEVLEQLTWVGERLLGHMNTPQSVLFTDVSKRAQGWLGRLDEELWEAVPEQAAFILEDQGPLSSEEVMRYGAWQRDAASLRITVERKLRRLRQVRAKL